MLSADVGARIHQKPVMALYSIFTACKAYGQLFREVSRSGVM